MKPSELEEKARLESVREQLWAKLADVWLAEIYLSANDVIEPSKELVQVMSKTIMGELLAKGLTTHEEMIKKFKEAS